MIEFLQSHSLVILAIVGYVVVAVVRNARDSERSGILLHLLLSLVLIAGVATVRGLRSGTTDAILSGSAALLVVIATSLLVGRFVAFRLMTKYLLKRRLAWIAIVAVMLCVWLVLVVNSVMGGWLRMFEESYRTMAGDLIIARPGMRGFEEYEKVLEKLRAMPEVAGAIPIIKTFGIVSGPGGFQNQVIVVGLPADATSLELKLDGVMQFDTSLWLQSKEFAGTRWVKPRAPGFALWPDMPYEAIGGDLPGSTTRPGMIVGSGTVGVLRDAKDAAAGWNRKFGVSATNPAPLALMKLTVAPPDRLSDTTTVPMVASYYWIVDGSRTQLPLHDNSVYVPFDALQSQLGFEGQWKTKIDENFNPVLGPDGQPVRTRSSGRTSEIHVKLKDGTRAAELKLVVQKVVDDVLKQSGVFSEVRVQTWAEEQGHMIGAIQNEINLTTTLFAFISVVAVFMVFAIFYMIVMEKTRDIGIIKSVGASRWTIASIFLGYGAVIGLVGGGLGVVFGWLTVKYINEIHTMLGVLFKVQIWSAETYAFDLIPNKVNPTTAAIVLVCAIGSAIVGAIVPAMRAAWQKPVESLRFE
jgi:lipoprotein-releasing system permease protein